MNGEQELEYWRELALAYRGELDSLRARVIRFLESPSDASLILLRDAFDADRIARTDQLTTTDVQTALDDLWSRVAADP